MADVFNKARQLSPCVVVIEDLDSLITDKNRSFFLNQLDGLEGNDGLLVIGTTNPIATTMILRQLTLWTRCPLHPASNSSRWMHLTYCAIQGLSKCYEEIQGLLLIHPIVEYSEICGGMCLKYLFDRLQSSGMILYVFKFSIPTQEYDTSLAGGTSTLNPEP